MSPDLMRQGSEPRQRLPVASSFARFDHETDRSF
jgi:hypothetical protein